MPFNELLKLKTSYAKRDEIVAAAQAIVFIDNRFPDFFSQIDYLFSSRFLPEQTCILTRFRWSNWRQTLQQAARYGVPVAFYTSLSTIPKIGAGKTIIYPYNAQTNLRMMLNDQCTHVFVGHGDSNKKASCNPLLRAYDHVLISGELAFDRLRDSGIILSEHGPGNTVRVGASLLDLQFSKRYKRFDGGDQGYVGYFPTWEGGFDAENYSSLAEPATVPVLVALCEKLGTGTIVIDPHPNIGRRLKAYQIALRKICLGLIEAGIAVKLYLDRRKSFAIKPIMDLVEQGQIEILDGVVSLKYAAVDVSAAETIVAGVGVSSVVMLRKDIDYYSPPTYRSIRERALLPTERLDLCLELLSDVGGSSDLERQAMFQRYVFSCEVPTMQDMSAKERWEFLSANVFKSRARSKADRQSELVR